VRFASIQFELRFGGALAAADAVGFQIAAGGVCATPGGAGEIFVGSTDPVFAERPDPAGNLQSVAGQISERRCRCAVARVAAAASLSDNAAADTVLRVAGGPAEVDAYIKSLGVQGFHLEDGEHALHRDASAQYRNWLEPAGAVQLLRRLSDNSPLTAEHTQLLLGWLKDSPTGPHRIKAELPAETSVMHKTGTSGVKNGLAAATNDLGLIVLPDGRRLALAVFVTDSKADEATREAVIGRIAKAAYSAAVARK
jgi:hypothetical protein